MQKLNLSNPGSNEGQTSVDSAVLVADNVDSGGDDNQYAVEIKTPSTDTSMKKIQTKFLLFAFVAIFLGVVTGFSGYKLFASPNVTAIQDTEGVVKVVDGKVQKGDTFGSDSEDFKDTAKGFLEAGGFDDEGSHKLLRPGGDSQTVYLTSSVTDMSEFEGMEIEVWGETFQGQNVGWLMDVGRVKIVETDASAPTEE